MIVIDAGSVRRLFPLAAAVAVLREAFQAYSAGRVVQPLRQMIPIPPDRVFAVMPAQVLSEAGDEVRAFGLKALSINPGNAARQLPVHAGQILVFDPDTGVVLAAVDAVEVTALRTAAASAVATDLLAAPEAGRLAVLGAGVQARSHLRAICAIRPITEVSIWNRNQDRAAALADWARERLSVTVRVVADPAAALRGAQVVCTVTASTEPLVTADLLEPGMHLNAVGSSFAGKRELDGAAVGRCTVVVDSLASARAEAGDLLLAEAEGAFELAQVRGEVGQLLLGSVPGRQDPAEITLFKSLGLAVQDVLAADYIYRQSLIDRQHASGRAMPRIEG